MGRKIIDQEPDHLFFPGQPFMVADIRWLVYPQSEVVRQDRHGDEGYSPAPAGGKRHGSYHLLIPDSDRYIPGAASLQPPWLHKKAFDLTLIT